MFYANIMHLMHITGLLLIYENEIPWPWQMYFKSKFHSSSVVCPGDVGGKIHIASLENTEIFYLHVILIEISASASPFKKTCP